MLEREVYQDHRVTIYCGAKFDAKKNIKAHVGFITDKLVKCKKYISHKKSKGTRCTNGKLWLFFSEWRERDPSCVDSKGKFFKGRKCASKFEYRMMYSHYGRAFNC